MNRSLHRESRKIILTVPLKFCYFCFIKEEIGETVINRGNRRNSDE